MNDERSCCYVHRIQYGFVKLSIIYQATLSVKWKHRRKIHSVKYDFVVVAVFGKWCEELLFCASHWIWFERLGLKDLKNQLGRTKPRYRQVESRKDRVDLNANFDGCRFEDC